MMKKTYMNGQRKGMMYGGNIRKPQMAMGGEMSSMKPVPKENTGLANLPTPVRNKMGFMRYGGKVKNGKMS